MQPLTLRIHGHSIRPVLAGERFLITRRLAEITKDHFNQAKTPSEAILLPRLHEPQASRCMVNLSGVRAGDSGVLDPFCGTGGILMRQGSWESCHRGGYRLEWLRGQSRTSGTTG